MRKNNNRILFIEAWAKLIHKQIMKILTVYYKMKETSILV